MKCVLAFCIGTIWGVIFPARRVFVDDWYEGMYDLYPTAAARRGKDFWRAVWKEEMTA